MNIVDRFSTNVHQVLGNAIKTATELGNPEVEPIHLFLALISQKGSMATEILEQNNIKIETIKEQIKLIPQDKKHKTENPTIALSPLSEPLKVVIEKAMMIAYDMNHNFVGTEHLLSALLLIKDETVEKVIKQNKANHLDLQKQADGALENSGHLNKMSSATEMADQIKDSIFDENISSGNLPKIQIPAQNTNNKKKKSSALDFFASELTNEQKQKTVDPLIGRETEVERLIQILYRRTKNNPILLGDPGVGKTAIVEGLAKKIYEGNVPAALKNKKVYSLDMGLLLAGTMYRGEFESRLKQVVEEVSQNPNIILFIDEIHNIVGAGSNQGSMDAGNILKPALARGLIHCIGATTPLEYKKHIESDPALERRFQPIIVKEPTYEDTIKILNGLKTNYEKFHQIKIPESVIETIVELADKFIHNQHFPDKAIDLLDEAAAAKRLVAGTSVVEQKLHSAEKKLIEIQDKKEEAAHADKFEEANKLKKDEIKAQDNLNKLRAEFKNQKEKVLGELTSDDVVCQVARITGLPNAEVKALPASQAEKIATKLKEQIIAQEQTINQITETIVRARLGLQTENRPLASFMFIGGNDVGKTELAKTLAKVLYPDSDALIKLNGGELNESFSTSKLLGSPAGYVGYKENNQFTDKVKLNPYSVVLFDEVDKAHRDVIRLILQILDNGEITDSTGKKISFKHAIIILTTTIGADVAKNGDFGFSNNPKEEAKNYKAVEEKLKSFFSPEMISRLDNVCIFNNLNKENLAAITNLEVAELNKILSKYKTNLEISARALDWLAKIEGKKINARELRKNVRKELEKIAAKIILTKKTADKYKVDLKNEELTVKAYGRTS